MQTRVANTPPQPPPPQHHHPNGPASFRTHNDVAVDCRGKRGGLRDNHTLKVRENSERFCLVTGDGQKGKWLLDVYASSCLG